MPTTVPLASETISESFYILIESNTCLWPNSPVSHFLLTESQIFSNLLSFLLIATLQLKLVAFLLM